jgi:hypothetical protein
VAAVRSHHPGAVTEVRFVLFGRRAYDAFRSALDA